MSKSNPFNDLDAHQELMKKIQEAVDKVAIATAEVSATREAVADHDLDATSHSDIRRAITEAGSTSSEDIDNRVAQHNESTVSHADIRADIEALKTDTSTMTPVILERIEEHNSSETAHADIRQSLATLKSQLSDIDVTTLNTTVENLKDTITNDVGQKIISLQTVDAHHDDLIAKNTNAIAGINKNFNNVSNNIATVANSVSDHWAVTDVVALKVHCLDREAVLGCVTEANNSVNIISLTTDLPTYIGNHKSIAFSFDNITDSEGGENFVLDIEQLNGDYILTPSVNVGPKQQMTIVTGETGKAGDILDFKVTFKDLVSNVNITRVFALMIARPITSGSVALTGLDTDVEPDTTNSFYITNLSDLSDGRYTYSIDPLTSDLTFSKTEDIAAGEYIEFIVPADAVRNTDLNFNVIIVDSQGSDSTIEVAVHVNALPSNTGFTTNTPGTVVPNTTYDIRFSGITSVHGTNATYEVIPDDVAGYISFSKTTGIIANENIKMMVAVDSIVTRGHTYTFQVKSTDENGIEFTFDVPVEINILPLANDIITTLPNASRGGQTLGFVIDGGSDEIQKMSEEVARAAAKSVVAYTIDPVGSALSFSKTSNIAPGEEIFVTLPKVADDTVRTFKIYAVDDLGEKSATPQLVQITLTPIFVPVTPEILSPVDGSVITYGDITATWTEFKYSVDLATVMATSLE